MRLGSVVLRLPVLHLEELEVLGRHSGQSFPDGFHTFLPSCPSLTLTKFLVLCCLMFQRRFGTG